MSGCQCQSDARRSRFILGALLVGTILAEIVLVFAIGQALLDNERQDAAIADLQDRMVGRK